MSRCTNEELGELITRYQMGQLSDEECDRFEEHVMDCEFCFRELEQTTPLMSPLRRHRVAILEGLHREGISYESLKKELLFSRSVRQPLYGKLLARAAQVFENLRRPRVLVPVTGIAAAVVLFFLLIPHRHNPYITHLSYEKLPYQSDYYRGEASAEAESLFSRGIDDYLADNYKDAIANLENAVDRAPDEGSWWLYLGVCYYLDRQVKRAIKALTMADSLTQFYNKERARWYLAQAHLLNRNPKKAFPLLEWIIAQNRIYAERADSLLKTVQSIDRGEYKTEP